jgi:hypothetical protein
MPTYQGGCHCGAVRFEIVKPVAIDQLVDCNCSICTKKGILHCPVEDDEFRLISGDGAISLYKFGSGDAEHRFCRHCGIHVFGRPRNNPDRHTVNARCLDDFEAVRAVAESAAFNGRGHPKDNAG